MCQSSSRMHGARVEFVSGFWTFYRCSVSASEKGALFRCRPMVLNHFIMKLYNEFMIVYYSIALASLSFSKRMLLRVTRGSVPCTQQAERKESLCPLD